MLKKAGLQLGKLRRYWRDFFGDSAYENYLARHRRIHPEEKPMTEKEFWRSRDDFNEDNVQTGCC